MKKKNGHLFQCFIIMQNGKLSLIDAGTLQHYFKSFAALLLHLNIFAVVKKKELSVQHSQSVFFFVFAKFDC